MTEKWQYGFAGPEMMLPREIQLRPRARWPFLLLAFFGFIAVANPWVQAQIVSSGYVITRVLGTDHVTVVDTGDAVNNAQRVNIVAGGAGGGTSSSFGSAIPSTGTASGFSDGTNMQLARVFDIDSGAGTQYGLGVNLRKSASGGSTELIGQGTMANSLPVALASDQSAIPVSQSGSWSLAANQSVNTAQINGVTPLMGNGTTGTGSQRVTIASDNTAFTVNAAESGTWTVQPGNTANTTAWLMKHYPVTACGGTVSSTAWVAVPTSLTSVTGTTSCIMNVQVANTTSGALTLLLTDGQGSPVTIIPTISIPGNSWANFPFSGTQAVTGYKWQASGAGLTAAVLAYQ